MMDFCDLIDGCIFVVFDFMFVVFVVVFLVVNDSFLEFGENKVVNGNLFFIIIIDFDDWIEVLEGWELDFFISYSLFYFVHVHVIDD